MVVQVAFRALLENEAGERSIQEPCRLLSKFRVCLGFTTQLFLKKSKGRDYNSVTEYLISSI